MPFRLTELTKNKTENTNKGISFKFQSSEAIKRGHQVILKVFITQFYIKRILFENL